MQKKSYPNSHWRPAYAEESESSSLPIKVELYGHEYWEKGRRFQRRSSELVSLEMICEGDTQYLQNKVVSLAQKGQLYILRPGVLHDYSTGPSGFCLKRFVVISGPLLVQLLQSTGVPPDEPIDLLSSSRVISIFRKIWKLRLDPEPWASMQASAYAYQILLHTIESQRAVVPSYLRPVIKRVSTEGPWPTLGDLAKLAGLSVSQFGRSFKASMSKSPMDFAGEIRLKKAAFYLSTTDWPVGVIANRLGYETLYYFSNHFKQYYNLSPKAYRLKKS